MTSHFTKSHSLKAYFETKNKSPWGGQLTLQCQLLPACCSLVNNAADRFRFLLLVSWLCKCARRLLFTISIRQENWSLFSKTTQMRCPFLATTIPIKCLLIMELSLSTHKQQAKGPHWRFISFPDLSWLPHLHCALWEEVGVRVKPPHPSKGGP